MYVVAPLAVNTLGLFKHVVFFPEIETVGFEATFVTNVPEFTQPFTSVPVIVKVGSPIK